MCKWLCEDVGHLEVGSNTGQFDVPTQALVAHEVIEFCDVFRSLVMHRIFRNLDAGLVVLHDWNTATGKPNLRLAVRADFDFASLSGAYICIKVCFIGNKC